nr:outer membrane beta-barrel protein [uncultured Prevotella sp.]
MKIKFLALAAAMMISTTSFAQFSQSKSSSSSSNEISKGWNSLYVQYNSIGTSYSLSSFNVRYDDYGDEYQKAIDNSGLSEKLNAFSIGYNRTINLTPSAPLYLEIGAALQYAFYSDEVDHLKYTGNMLTAKVPVSLLYHVAIPNSDFAIEPFAGIDFKYNIIGTAKREVTYKYYGETKKDEDKLDNIFDKKDCDGHQANRFQAGWHVGANFVYKKAFIGISYGQDFSKFHDDIDLKFNTLSATLGCRF